MMNKNEEINYPLLSIDVQLTENEIATLKIDDIIEEKIKQFCKIYKLPESDEEILNQQVKQQLNNQIEECKYNHFNFQYKIVSMKQ